MTAQEQGGDLIERSRNYRRRELFVLQTTRPIALTHRLIVQLRVCGNLLRRRGLIPRSISLCRPSLDSSTGPGRPLRDVRLNNTKCSPSAAGCSNGPPQVRRNGLARQIRTTAAVVSCRPNAHCSPHPRHRLQGTGRKAICPRAQRCGQGERSHGRMGGRESSGRATERAHTAFPFGVALHLRLIPLLAAQAETATKPLRVMISGAPAAGKGTQCAKIVEKVSGRGRRRRGPTLCFARAAAIGACSCRRVAATAQALGVDLHSCSPRQ
jgi:hypothetical protein